MSHLLGSWMIVVNGNGSVTEDETCEVELAPQQVLTCMVQQRAGAGQNNPRQTSRSLVHWTPEWFLPSARPPEEVLLPFYIRLPQMIECLIVPQRPNLERFGQTAALSFRGGERNGVKQVIWERLCAGERTCAALLMSLIASVCFDDQLLFTD